MTQHYLFCSKALNGHCIGLSIVHVNNIIFDGTTEFENRLQRALGGLKMGAVKRHIGFLGRSVVKYKYHIEVKPDLLHGDPKNWERAGGGKRDGNRRRNGGDGEVADRQTSVDDDKKIPKSIKKTR